VVVPVAFVANAVLLPFAVLVWLAITEAKLGRNHPETAAALNSLGELYRDTGRYAEAEKAYTRGLAITEAKQGRGHADTAAILHNLGELYMTTGRYAEAEALWRSRRRGTLRTPG
jgi:tetratricopeptide (TPR) repeat protein